MGQRRDHRGLVVEYRLGDWDVRGSNPALSKNLWHTILRLQNSQQLFGQKGDNDLRSTSELDCGRAECSKNVPSSEKENLHKKGHLLHI